MIASTALLLLASPAAVFAANPLASALKRSALAAEVQNLKEAFDGVETQLQAGNAGLMQLTACAEAAGAVQPTLTAVAQACQMLPAELVDTMFTTAATTAEGVFDDLCTEFNRQCAPALAATTDAITNALDVCTGIDTGTTFGVQNPNPLDSIRNPIATFVTVSLFAQMSCLQVEDELCAVVLRDAFVETADNFTDCRTVFASGECREDCTEVAATFFEDAGCCFTGYLAAFQYALNVAVPDFVEFTLPSSYCNEDIAFCREIATFMADSIDVEIVNPNPETNPPAGGTGAASTLAPMMVAAAVSASLASANLL